MQTSMRRVEHYRLIRKLGFPDGVRCFCGAEITFHLHERDQDKKRKAFFDAHDDCKPKVDFEVWLHQQERGELYA